MCREQDGVPLDRPRQRLSDLRLVPGHGWSRSGERARLTHAKGVLVLIIVTMNGKVLNMNIPPERTGKMNASVAMVMAQAPRPVITAHATSPTLIMRHGRWVVP